MTAAGNYKVPPTFGEKTSYKSWENEIEIWRLITDRNRSRPERLPCPYQEELEITVEHLNADTGMTGFLNC